MYKVIINKLDIFTPLSKEQFVENEDFDIDNFLHFRVLINDDGSVWGHNRKRKLLYGRSHLSSKSSKILNVKNPRFLHSI